MDKAEILAANARKDRNSKNRLPRRDTLRDWLDLSKNPSCWKIKIIGKPEITSGREVQIIMLDKRQPFFLESCQRVEILWVWSIAMAGNQSRRRE